MAQQVPKRIGLILAFFGGIIAILVLQDSNLQQPASATTIINMPPSTAQQPIDPVPEQPVAPTPEQMSDPIADSTPSPSPSPINTCNTDEECPLPITYCSNEGKCRLLAHPFCTCSQPEILRCSDSEGNARHTFCPGGCLLSTKGARCS